MKTYNEYIVNELFDKWKKPKSKKYKYESDQEMDELVNNIIDNFNIEKLEWGHRNLDTNIYDCRLDTKNSINLKKEVNRSSINWSFSINGQKISLEFVSEDYLEKLAVLFYEEEKKKRIKKNTDIFSKVLPSRRDAEKYNL
jgi:hypothetical protein